MTTYLGKSCSFCLPRVPFVNCRQFMYLVISLFGFEGRIWDLIVSVPDHCLSFYFTYFETCKKLLYLTDQLPCFIYCHIYLNKGCLVGNNLQSHACNFMKCT